MIDQSVAGTASTRTLRGIRMFLDRRREVERRTRHEWGVPSCSADETYLVNLKRLTCTCKDHPRATAINEECKHLVCVRLVKDHRDALKSMCKRERAKR